MMTEEAAKKSRLKGLWPELGVWNLYFLLKLGLYFSGHLNLQALPNLVFIGFLLIPLSNKLLRTVRQLFAIPAGIALLYQDTWLPPFSRLLNQPGVLDFSFEYFIEIIQRTISWPMLGLFFIAVIFYLYVHIWVRLSFISIVMFFWLGLQQGALLPENAPGVSVAQLNAGAAASDADAGIVDELVPLDLNRVLSSFWEKEKNRHVVLDSNHTGTPIDILFLSVCSLSWDDLESTGLISHPLFDQFDLVFDHFNTATSYSGPAVRRLMRATCGQSSHDSLHQKAPAQCSLMDQLASQGMEVEVLFNHTGEFDGFGDMVLSESKNLQISPLLSEKKMQRAFIGFDGSPVWRDREVLSSWWQQMDSSDRRPRALLYNSITLHDGNRVALPNGGSRRSEYRELAAGLLDDIAGVIQMLERSGRPLILVLIPEHGASLAGDRMQIAGMREIPSPAITHVPVALKLLGLERAGDQELLRIGEQSSYLALAELLKRLLEHSPDEPLDLARLARNLPETNWISENEETVVLQTDGGTHIRLKKDGQWLPYPEARQ